MKKKIRSLVILVFTCIMIAGALSACAGNKKDTSQSNQNTQNNASATSPAQSADNSSAKKLSGEIGMAGSTSMEKLANAAAQAFMTKHPDVSISPEFIGSGAGIEALLAGTVDIGNSSRKLSDDEKSKGAVENIVAIDGIAVIVDKANTTANLTKDQLAGIYSGTIKNWKEIGGTDQPIVVVGRESGSGTRDAFEEILGLKDKCAYSNEINSTGGVLAKVASTPGAIGYVSLDILDSSVNAMKIDNVDPTEENIKAGKYLLSRPFVMATKGEISQQSELVQEFFKYMTSDEGKVLIKEVGLITVD